MSSPWSLALQERPSGGTTRAPRSKGLATLTYRSRAALALSDAELGQLLQSAQERNRAEGLTGLLIYDEGRFFQWLEGPGDSLVRIWQSIREDRRHTDIELLGHSPTPVRLFADWTLKLASRHTLADHAVGDALDVPPGLIDTLSRHPGSAPALLTTLAPRPLPQASLAGVLEQWVIPQLVARHAPRRAPDVAGAGNAGDLARLLVAVDPGAAFELLDRLLLPADSIGRWCAHVFEPAARGLGDLWCADDCSEWDVTLGLCRLQTALHRAAPGRGTLAALPLHAVLVAPQPGEPHMLSAALDAEVLWQAGWDAHCEYPPTDEALQDLLADTWFDALDLSLSAAFQREHWLPRLTTTIAQARRASRNPAMVVVVGGRLFAEQDGAGRRVGADAGSATAQQTGLLISRSLLTHA